MVRFQIEWQNTPVINILDLWDRLIRPDKNPELVGANLKIDATPPTGQDPNKTIHTCTLFGYYEGTEVGLKESILRWVSEFPPIKITVPVPPDGDPNLWLDDAWERVSTVDEMIKLNQYDGGKIDLEEFARSKEAIKAKAVRSDIGGPAPHKVTSRVVEERGLSHAEKLKLIGTLESAFVPDPKFKTGIFCIKIPANTAFAGIRVVLAVLKLFFVARTRFQPRK